jgi:hypothetical protein
VSLTCQSSLPDPLEPVVSNYAWPAVYIWQRASADMPFKVLIDMALFGATSRDPDK